MIDIKLYIFLEITLNYKISINIRVNQFLISKALRIKRIKKNERRYKKTREKNKKNKKMREKKKRLKKSNLCMYICTI